MVREYFAHFGRFSRAAKMFLGAHFLYGVVHATIFILRNLFLRKLGYEEPFIGSTMAAAAFGMVAVVALLPRFMDRMKLRGFLGTGVALLAGGLAGVALLPYEGDLGRYEFPVMAFCFLSGVGGMMFEVGTAPFYTRHSSGEERPYLFGMGMALSPTAGLAAALALSFATGTWAESIGTYRIVMLGGASGALLCGTVLLFIREEPPSTPSEAESEDRLNWPLAFKFALPEMIIGLGAGMTIPILNLYFLHRFGVEAGTFALFFAGTQLLLMGGFLLAPIIARRAGAVRTVTLFQLTSFPFFLALAFCPVALPAVAIVAFVFRHPTMNMIHPVSANFMMVVSLPRQRVRINAMKLLANKIAWVIATWSGGRIVEFASPGAENSFLVDGYTAVMLITILLYVAGAALYWNFFRRVDAGQAPASAPEPTTGT